MDKLMAIAIITVFVGSAIVIAQPEIQNIATQIRTQINFPDMLVMQGVAVKNDTITSVLFLAMDKESGYKFQNSYIIVNGDMHKLTLIKSSYDRNTQTALMKFNSDKGIVDITLKVYGNNSSAILVGSGTFDGYVLNMKLTGTDPMPILINEQDQEPSSIPGGEDISDRDDTGEPILPFPRIG